MQGQDAALSMSNDTKQQLDSADLVGLKDGVIVTPTLSSNDNMIVLCIKCPSLHEASSAESNILTVPSHFSIGQIKRRIESTWPGRPQAQGMRIFRSGQLLTDEMVIDDVVPPSDRSEPAAIHLVIRSTAWSEPRPSLQARTSNPKATRSPPSPHPAWVAADSPEATFSPPQMRRSALPLPALHFPTKSHRSNRMSVQDIHLASVIENMDQSNYPSFRSLLTWSYYQYVDQYESLWKEMYGQWSKEPAAAIETSKSVEQLAKEMDCSIEEVLSAVKLVETEALQWSSLEEEIAKVSQADKTGMTYKTVTLQGLPYLLQVKRDSRSGPLQILLGRIKRLQDVIHRIDKLISYQTLFEQASNTSALQADMRSRQSALLAAAAAANGAIVPPTGAPDARPRRYMLEIEFNLNHFLTVAVPSFLLSLKVTFLVYIFTRDASTFKTCMVAGIGAAYVMFSAWKTIQRQTNERRGAERPQAQAQRRSGSTTPQPEVASEQNSLESLRPRAPVRQRATSPFTLDYWIDSLAYIGLASEEREFQWHPMMEQRGDQQQNLYWKAVKNYLLLPLLLMVVTLVPEIEQKRRRAIDERENLIRSTAKKVEDRKARLSEKKEDREEKQDELSSSSLSSSIVVDEEIPSFLQHSYCQRVIHQRRIGRQIDIAQELEAAAAAAGAAGAGEPNMGQAADMGFI